MKKFIAIILAAGKGTRFKSDLPKVLHPIQNKPMIYHVIESVQACNISNICLVVGYKREEVLNACKSFNPNHAIQEEQLGTGHAVVCAFETIKSSAAEHCLILAGDCPLIQPSTLEELINIHQNTNAAATLLTATLPDAGNYGRIIRDNKNQIIAIREAKDCNSEELKIGEFNSGIYCFNTKELLSSISKLSTNNAQKEYYLTDVIAMLHNENKTLSGHCINTEYEVLGANTQDELAALNQKAQPLAALQ